jgi:hypothetical protein
MTNFRIDRWLRGWLVVAILSVGVAGLATRPGAAPPVALVSRASYGQPPLTFEQNVGQFDARAQFVARGGGVTTYLTADGAVFTVPLTADEDANRASFAAVRMRVEGGAGAVRPTTEGHPSGVSHYLIGSDPSGWHTNVPHYGAVRYVAVYPGIDLLYTSEERRLRYDFVLSPGADPNLIRLRFDGARAQEIDGAGNLLLHVGEAGAGAVLTHGAPFTYQERGGQRMTVESRFVLEGESVAFALGAYDPTLPLIIDPDLIFATYLGGGSIDNGNGIAVDNAGNVYLTGTTTSVFPTTAGVFDTSLGGVSDIFVTKLNASGTALVYSTYVGGSSEETGEAIVVDASGNAYVTGTTLSANFPTTFGAADTTSGAPAGEGVIFKLNAAGSALTYSTFVGGSNDETTSAIALDGDGAAYVVGFTSSTNFPTTVGAFDTSANGNGDAFIVKLNAAGTSFAYATLLGGTDTETGDDLALDPAKNVYITGYTGSDDFPTTVGAFDMTFAAGDIFVTKLNTTGSALVYSTLLGGAETDTSSGIAVDSSGSAYVTGAAVAGFPTTGGAYDTTLGGPQDAFVTKFNAAGTALVYSTLLGGSDTEYGSDLALDAAGRVYVIGGTFGGFPTTAGAYDSTYNDNGDLFLTVVNAAGTALAYSTYYGSIDYEEGHALVVDISNDVYLTGLTIGPNLPTTVDVFDTSYNGDGDTFIAKLSTADIPAVPPQISPKDVVIGSLTPTYRWGAISRTLQYALQVVNLNTGQLVVNTTFNPSICAAGECAATPSTALANSATHVWYVAAGNAAGWSAFASGMVFTPSVVPAAPSIVSPAGVFNSQTLNPAYQWTKVDGAVLYAIAVFDLNTSSLQVFQSFSAATVCPTLGTTCSATPMGAGTTLTNGGTYGWFVAALSYAGPSAWSEGAAFIIFAPPATPTLVSPLNTVTGSTPTYVWNRVPGAVQYNLAVYQSALVFEQLVNATTVCSGNTCQFTQPTPLSAGSHSWFVAAINQVGVSSYAPGAFTVSGGSQPELAPPFQP